MRLPADRSTFSIVWVLVSAAVVALLGGIFVAPQGYVLLASLLLVLAIGTAWPWITIWGVTCELEFETPRGREFEVALVRMNVVNRWPWPVWGLTVEDITPASALDPGVGLLLAIPSLPGASRTVLRWEFQPTRRGNYPRHGWRIGTAFPFDITRAGRSIDVRQPLLVWPAVVKLKALPPAAISQLHGNSPTSIIGHHGETCGVRPYRHGDSVRMVHWAATARATDLMVRELQTSVSSLLTVEIRWPTPQAGPSEADATRPTPAHDCHSFDKAIRLAASFCSEAVRQGHMAMCVMDQSARTAGARPGDLRQLMDWLAVVSPSTCGCPDRSTSNVGSTRQIGRRIVIVPEGDSWQGDGRAISVSTLLENASVLRQPVVDPSAVSSPPHVEKLGIAVYLSDRALPPPQATTRPLHQHQFPHGVDSMPALRDDFRTHARPERRNHAVA
ncbi:MAG: DUF58 domain-containing protein [Pirellulales bacterium]